MARDFVRYWVPPRGDAYVTWNKPVTENEAWQTDYVMGRGLMKAGAPYHVSLVRYLGATLPTWEIWNRAGYRCGTFTSYDDLVYHAIRHGFADYFTNLWEARWYALNEDGDCYSTMYAAAAALDLAVYKAHHPRRKLLLAHNP